MPKSNSLLPRTLAPRQTLTLSRSPRSFPPLSRFYATSPGGKGPVKPLVKSSAKPSTQSATTSFLDGKSRRNTDIVILKHLFGYVWPKGKPWVKVRVVLALSLLVGGKILNVQVPFFFKEVVDRLNLPLDPDATLWTVAGAMLAGCT